MIAMLLYTNDTGTVMLENHLNKEKYSRPIQTLRSSLPFSCIQMFSHSSRWIVDQNYATIICIKDESSGNA